MKRLFKTFALILMVSVLVGCAKKNIHMDVTNSKVTISVTDAMASSLRDEAAVAELMEEYKAKGYDVKEYPVDEEGMLGVVYSKTYKLSEVSGKNPVEFHLETIGTDQFNDSQIFKVDGNTYSATFVFDTLAASVGNFDPEEVEENASMIEITYSVTLPNKAESHNADSVDGKTYTWNISYGEKAEINYVFKTTSPIMTVVIIILAIAVIGVVAYLVTKKVSSNKKAQSNEVTSVPDTIADAPVETVAKEENSLSSEEVNSEKK